MNCTVDHLVVVAASLAQGVAWCEATLGVTPGPGGRHALFGTHNRLLRLDAAPGTAFERCYFEIIAVDPEAPAPARARWFGLDTPALQAAIAVEPRLVHVVARCDDVAAVRARVLAAGHDPGAVLEAGRDTPQGRLEWRITVSDDGRLAAGGALPTLLQWRGAHPTDAMPASGLSLRALHLAGVAPALRTAYALQGVAWRDAPAPALHAVIATPRGEVALQSLPPSENRP
jgi:hypothetical protein